MSVLIFLLALWTPWVALPATFFYLGWNGFGAFFTLWYIIAAAAGTKK